MTFNIKALYLQVADEFINRIATGVWKVGPPLPGEQELAAALNVSVGTIRRAFEILEDRHLIERRRGRGTFVIEHSTYNVPHRFTHLDQGINQGLGSRATIISQDVVACTDEERERLHLAAGESCIVVRLNRRYDDVTYMVERTTVPVRLFPGLVESGLPLTKVTDIARKWGHLPLHAVEEISIKPIPADLAGELGVEPQQMMLHIDRVVLTDNNRPIEWRRGFCQLDEHIKYHSVIY